MLCALPSLSHLILQQPFHGGLLLSPFPRCKAEAWRLSQLLKIDQEASVLWLGPDLRSIIYSFLNLLLHEHLPPAFSLDKGLRGVGLGGGLPPAPGWGSEGGSPRCFWGETDKVRCTNAVNNRRDTFTMTGITKAENPHFQPDTLSICFSSLPQRCAQLSGICRPAQAA